MSGFLNSAGEKTTAVAFPPEDSVDQLGESSPANGSKRGAISGDQIKGVVASALDAIAQSGSTDQFRGYANEAIGETKLNIGLAVGSPELALLGIAQKALGQAQRYIGEAKAAIEADLPVSFVTVIESSAEKATSLPEDHSEV